MKQIDCDLLVVGGGPAGLAAAVEAKRNGIASVIVIERDTLAGGILRQCIHDGFGLHTFGKRMSGGQYAQCYIDRAAASGVRLILDTMVLEIRDDLTVYATNGEDGLLCLKTKAIVLAMGCREKTRNQIFLYGDRPSGVMTAGTVQRYINIDGYLPGKKAVILGSGDIGLIMARRMTLEGIKVEGVYEVMPSLGGLRRNVVQCLEDYHIPLYLSTTVTFVHGKERLVGVTVAEVDANRNPLKETERYVDCDLLVLAVGLIPENELSVNMGVWLDPVTKGPMLDQRYMTSVAGVFAAGNVAAVFDLVDYVTQTGEAAGRAAAQYIIKGNRERRPQKIEYSENIAYVFPQHFDTALGGEASLDLYLRVKRSMRGVKLKVCSGESMIYQKTLPIALPPEMVHAVIPTALIGQGVLTVTLEEAAS